MTEKISQINGGTKTTPALTDLFEREDGGGNSKYSDLAQLMALFGGVHLITETVTSGSATNVSFTSIPSTYRDLRVVVRGRGTTAATFDGVSLRLNADTGANYDQISQQLNNATSTVSSAVAQTKAFVGDTSASTAPASASNVNMIDVPNYKDTTFQKSGSFRASLKTGTTTAGIYSEHGHFWWRSTSAITQIDIFPNAGGFVDGSVVSLYGLY